MILAYQERDKPFEERTEFKELENLKKEKKRDKKRKDKKKSSKKRRHR